MQRHSGAGIKSRSLSPSGRPSGPIRQPKGAGMATLSGWGASREAQQSKPFAPLQFVAHGLATKARRLPSDALRFRATQF